MKFLALLTVGNMAVLPMAFPALAAVTVVAVLTAWLAWPLIGILEG